MEFRIYPGRLSESERMQVVMQYANGNKSAKDIAKEYGIGLRTFERWIREYKDFCKNEKNVVPLQSKTATPPQTMDYATPQDEISALKAELEKERKARLFAENKVIALNRMFDIAEKQGILIRKNFGAKQ